MSEINKLKKALEFLTSHIPGANELAEMVNEGSLVLNTSHEDSPEDVLLAEPDKFNDSEKEQKMLDAFKTKKLNNLEVGRLYERYVGYLYEKEGCSVTYKGIVDGLNDLGRDLICIKNNEHKIVQAKCWSKHTVIRENHIYQLFGSFTHYRMQLRQVFKATHGRIKAREMMKNIKITPVICSNNDLSETAKDVIKFLNIEHRQIKLIKDYPMIKCNINNERKLYHLPFDPAYDSIIIGNVNGECYANTIKEAQNLGFKRVNS